MSDIAYRGAAERVRKAVASDELVLPIFTATLFLSAFLLFSVQPIFAKMVLPKLGGSPSVWAVSMCFFQGVLLAGYCYAHALNRYVGLATAPLIHLCLLGVACLALPFGLPAGAEPPPGDAYLWLISVLAIGVGLPFFAISASAPLLQAWFARTGHAHANDPYFLYGASNLGSLLALLAYPVLIEPAMGLQIQADRWTTGFVLLGLLVSLSALSMRFAISRRGGNATVVAAGETAPVEIPTAGQRLAWIAYAFVPSGLLVAFTSYVATDIASAPFLWVIPLAIFLATFIVVFRDEPLVSHELMLKAQPILVGIVLVAIADANGLRWYLANLGGFAVFLVTTLVCHRELFNRRPAVGNLTEFYLWMSLGGVLGGVFAALVAPKLFNAIIEFPLLLVLGLACRPGIGFSFDAKARSVILPGLALLAAILLLAALVQRGTIAMSGLVVLGPVLLLFLLMMLSLHQPRRLLVLASLQVVALATLPTQMSGANSERSFFGVHRVLDRDGGRYRTLAHGTTLHGAQRLLDANGKPVPVRESAVSYYYDLGPMPQGVQIVRRVRGEGATPLKVGVVGLGAGAMACRALPGERWRFYEIDPVVVDIATDPKRFTFLSTCQPNADIVVGDARLTLDKEPRGSFDYLLIDAFSSDSIPVHLLTAQAISKYLDLLTPDGLLALHVSNRHMDLEVVASATALSIPGAKVVFAPDRPDPSYGANANPSNVVFVSRSQKVIDEAAARSGAKRIEQGLVTPWTDDYSDVVTSIWRRHVSGSKL